MSQTIQNAWGKVKEKKTAVRWIGSILGAFQKYLWIILGINIVSLLISYASTITGKYVVDFATGGEIQPRFILLMLLTSVASIVFGALAKMLGEYINEKFTFSLRADAYDKVQHATWSRITRYHSGDIVTRLTSDIQTLSHGLITVVPQLMVVTAQLLISFAILFYYDRPLAFFGLILGPFGACFSFFFRKRFKEYQLQLRESESEYRAFMQESLSHIGVVKSFQQEEAGNDYIKEIRNNRIHAIMANARLTSLMSSLSKVIYSIGYVTAFCWGTYRLSTGDITYGTLTVFITLFSQIHGSIGSLAHIIPQIYSILICSERIQEVAELESEPEAESVVLSSRAGLCMEQVWFAYDTEPVLREVNLTVRPGERIGIVGASGMGKTTLVRLLLALIRPTEGALFAVDDEGNREKVSAATRRLITYVPQGNTLFSGTIGQNLKMGKADATEEEMWAALEMADAADFVRKTEEGLQANLAERAGGLSEGQAQRIAIARALLRDRPILILDEATSALDEATESVVLRRLSQRMDKTCFIITHRRSMLQYCDRVLEIDREGQVHLQELPR